MIIKWFKNKVISWAREDKNIIRPESIASASVRGRRIEQDGMNFTLYTANGGYVIEYSTYDRKTDIRDTALHLIHNDQDLGQSIAHIITLEMLRK